VVINRWKTTYQAMVIERICKTLASGVGVLPDSSDIGFQALYINRNSSCIEKF
jgi:hypothetical protein